MDTREGGDVGGANGGGGIGGGYREGDGGRGGGGKDVHSATLVLPSSTEYPAFMGQVVWGGGWVEGRRRRGSTVSENGGYKACFRFWFAYWFAFWFAYFLKPYDYCDVMVGDL